MNALHHPGRVLGGSGVAGIGYRSFQGERQHLKDLNRIHPIQISLIRDFIVNGDPSALKDKPFLHIPFPDADQLVGLLSDPTIRSILPVSIRPTVQLESRCLLIARIRR